MHKNFASPSLLYDNPKKDCSINIYTNGFVNRNPNDLYDTQAGGSLYANGDTERESKNWAPTLPYFKLAWGNNKKIAKESIVDYCIKSKESSHM